MRSPRLQETADKPRYSIIPLWLSLSSSEGSMLGDTYGFRPRSVSQRWPESFYDFGGATKSITCLSFRR